MIYCPQPVSTGLRNILRFRNACTTCLGEIKQLSQGKGDLADAAKRAWKLLNSNRFLK